MTVYRSGYSGVWLLHGWCPRNCCCFVYTTLTCTSLQCRFIRSHIRRMNVCLTVTCHLHLWQNDRDLLRATAVTRIPKSELTQKMTPEKKTLPPLLPGLEPETFQSRVRRSTTEPLPFSSHLRSPTPSPPILTYLSCLLLVFQTFFNLYATQHAADSIFKCFRMCFISAADNNKRNTISITFFQIIIIYPNK